MAYSSFIHESIGTSKYSKLESLLALANTDKDVYVVNVRRNAKVPSGVDYVDMGDSINLIVYNLSSIHGSAGVTKFVGQSAGVTHLQAYQARLEAERKNINYSLFSSK